MIVCLSESAVARACLFLKDVPSEKLHECTCYEIDFRIKESLPYFSAALTMAAAIA